MHTEVVVAGAGIAGLLLASELASHVDLVLVERLASVPKHKYWLTDQASLEVNPDLEGAVGTRLPHMDFIAHEGSRARLEGPYVLWDTDALVTLLLDKIERAGARVLFDEALLSYRAEPSAVHVSTSKRLIKGRLLMDCMGHGSPIVSAKRTVRHVGFFFVQGRRVRLKQDIGAVGLHNLHLQAKPTYFELFPDGSGGGYAAMIAAARSVESQRSLQAQFRSVLESRHYRDAVELEPGSRGLFGIIPVGVPLRRALDRVGFFGESAQSNPATSATALSRMLKTYKESAARLRACLASDRLDAGDIARAGVPAMSRLHRYFQLALFRRLLAFTSDDFLQLVREIKRHPDELMNGLIFADHDFSADPSPLAQAVLRPRTLLGWNLLRGMAQAAVSLRLPGGS